MVFLDMPLLQQPEAYIGGAAKLLGDDGKINNDSTASSCRRSSTPMLPGSRNCKSQNGKSV
jgi:hypothetical protein